MYEASLAAVPSIKNGIVGLEAMKNIPADSIDYAVLEHSKLIKTVASNFYWTDLGSFDAIVNYFEEGNQVDNLKKISSKEGDSFVFSSKKVVGAEVSNLIVVDTEDSILILPRTKSDLVKNIYNSIKESSPDFI